MAPEHDMRDKTAVWSTWKRLGFLILAIFLVQNAAPLVAWVVPVLGLLLTRRTTTLGALVSVGVIANITAMSLRPHFTHRGPRRLAPDAGGKPQVSESVALTGRPTATIMVRGRR